jgi:hypothetical protein
MNAASIDFAGDSRHALDGRCRMNAAQTIGSTEIFYPLGSSDTEHEMQGTKKHDIFRYLSESGAHGQQPHVFPRTTERKNNYVLI